MKIDEKIDGKRVEITLTVRDVLALTKIEKSTDIASVLPEVTLDGVSQAMIDLEYEFFDKLTDVVAARVHDFHAKKKR